ncbi:MAG TPA: manno-octulosonate cytidylyltransferase [Sphingobium sp.]|uniref:3-deoxy-manno-octulosonate cytidylyltransferase n=1 Tax=Sphingobium sp. TaxID=1912891 RepID=UPI002ED0C4ED
MSRFAIIIPARYASTRFPGKPLAPLRGATGEVKSLIQRSWECASAIPGSTGVWIATDDNRIAEAVEAFGGKVVMTVPECRNGTERCAEAVAKLGDVADIFVNLQGDAPLTPDFVVEELVRALAADPGASMATPAIGCSATLYRHLVTDQTQGRVGGTTVVFNSANRALYFSKRVIPHVPDSASDEAHKAVHLHLGVYAYRPNALAQYAALPPSPLEALEGLEQLRFLEANLPIRIAPFPPIEWDCIELNNPEDTPAIEAILKTRGIA